MSFIQFENAREKEKIREELRKAREELLKRAQKNAETRAERQTEKILSGEAMWMLPNLEKKIENGNKEEKEQKKRKKEKKSKKKKKNKRNHTSSEDLNNASGTEEDIIKRKKKKKRKVSTEDSSSSTSSSPSVAPKNKECVLPAIRDDWMTTPMLLKTFSKNVNKPIKEKQDIINYDPRKNVRELNPHWKNDGTGLPSFRKPSEDFEADNLTIEKYSKSSTGSIGSWKKQKETISSTRKTYSSGSSSDSETEVEKDRKPELSSFTSDFLTDQQMNELGAKIIKAEIIGNNKLAEELKKKLESARLIRKQTKSDRKESLLKEQEIRTKNISEEHILLTTTDNKGISRPLRYTTEKESDRYGGRRSKQKNKKIETHVSGERVRYFPDDDKYNIKQMFEREKYTSASDSNAQFAKIAGHLKSCNDNLEDLFAEKVCKDLDDSEKASKAKQRAIDEHEKFTKKLDSCDKCFDSQKMEKHLLVSIGKTAYLALPYHEGLQPNHCLIVPIQHVVCSTQLDEDTWEEVSNFRKALTRMFSDQHQDVVFFETARYLHKRPHMVIHCVPARSMEMAPFYFKKAIQESEYEWSTNKQLVSLKEKDLRRSVPKGLPYFWVNFGMDSGFAHVIEDQERFPSNFAQEIIGGMLHLDAIQWRRPRREKNIIPKVKNFADLWKPYDFTDS